MKNLFALVFFFLPLAVAAGEIAPSVVLKLPYILEPGRNPMLPVESAPTAKHPWLHRNCCAHPEENRDRSLFSHQKQNWLRRLKETQRIRLSVFDSEVVLSTRESNDGAWHLGKVGKHGRVYGIEYRRTAWILDGSPRSLDFITRWFVTPETQ